VLTKLREPKYIQYVAVSSPKICIVETGSPQDPAFVFVAPGVSRMICLKVSLPGGMLGIDSTVMKQQHQSDPFT